MRLKTIEDYKKKLKLTQKQRELIIGLILGDGHLETQNNGQTYRLKIEHSIKQKEYTDWLYRNFIEWVNQPPKSKIKNSFGKKIESYWFNTYSSGMFRFYGKQFYFGKKKMIPKIIKKLLTPLSLAVWFMDDGSFKSKFHKTYIIHSLGYDKKELQIVQRVLEEKFSIKVGIHKQNRENKYRLYVYSDSANKFKKLIEPYIIPEMKYKLG